MVKERSMKDLFSINNKVVILTGGGGSGMANVLAKAMAKHGAFVYALDIKILDNNKNNKNLAFLKCDITNLQKFKKLCKKIFKEHNKIDVLVNAAGVTFPDSNKNGYPIKKWKKTMEVNLDAAFTCSNIVAKYMKRKSTGSIINFTSINAEMAFPDNPAYVASKGGLKMLGKALAKDLGRYGIRVNNIGPGYMKTEMTQKSWNNTKKRNARTSRTLLGRWGDKEEIVAPCIFLASDASSYITGQDIYVDGGWLTNGLSE